MRTPRLRYSLLTLMTIIALSAIIMGAIKARERERARLALGRARLTAAIRSCQSHLRAWKDARITAQEFYFWSRSLLEAERDLAGTSFERLAAVKAHQGRMEAIRTHLAREERRAAGFWCARDYDRDAIEYYLKEAAYWVAVEQ